jgi:hypothetical protein
VDSDITGLGGEDISLTVGGEEEVELLSGNIDEVDDEIDDRIKSKFIPLLLLDDNDILIFISKLKNRFFYSSLSVSTVSSLSSLTPLAFIISNCDEELKMRLIYFDIFEKIVLYMNSFELERSCNQSSVNSAYNAEWDIPFEPFIKTYIGQNTLNENSEIVIPQIYYHFKVVSQIAGNFFSASNMTLILYSSGSGDSVEVPLSKRTLLSSLFSDKPTATASVSMSYKEAYLPSFFKQLQLSPLIMFFMNRLQLCLEYLGKSALSGYSKRPMYARVENPLYAALNKSPIYLIINLVCDFFGKVVDNSMMYTVVVNSGSYEKNNIIARNELMGSIFSSLLFILAENSPFLISFGNKVLFSKEVDVSLSLFFKKETNSSNNVLNKPSSSSSSIHKPSESLSSEIRNYSVLDFLLEIFENIIVYGTLPSSIYNFSQLITKITDDFSPVYAF